MRAGEQKVARDYVIYREARAAERKNAGAASDVAQPHPSIRITRADGSLSPLDMGRLNTIISEACEGLAEVDGALIERETLKNLYDGVAEKDVNTALVMTARTLVEREPNYSYVTARLLMDTLRAEAWASSAWPRAPPITKWPSCTPRPCRPTSRKAPSSSWSMPS